MKKTIAILLILVIGMVGVFAEDDPSPAATTDLVLNTVVEEILKTKLVHTKIEGITKPQFEALEGEDILGSKTVGRGANENIGVLYIMTNHYAGYTLSISGEPLESDTSGIETVINYVLTAGDAVLDTADSSNNDTDEVTGIVSLTIDPYTVSVTLNTTDFDAAQAATDYTATVTFTFSAT